MNTAIQIFDKHIIDVKGVGVNFILDGLSNTIDFHRFNGSYEEFKRKTQPNKVIDTEDHLFKILKEINEKKKEDDLVTSINNTLSFINPDLGVMTESNLDDVMNDFKGHVKSIVESYFITEETVYSEEIIYNFLSEYLMNGNSSKSFEFVVSKINEKELLAEKVYNYFGHLNKVLCWCDEPDQTFTVFSHTDFEMVIRRADINNVYEHYKNIVL